MDSLRFPAARPVINRPASRTEGTPAASQPGRPAVPTATSGMPSLPAPTFAGFFQDKVQTYLMGKDLQAMQPLVTRVNAIEASVQAMSDAELKNQTQIFRERIAEQVGKPLSQLVFPADTAKVQAALDAILPEAFAVAREACRRTLKMRPFDVQVLAGVALHQRRIVEMKTGEGKTLAAVMPAYLNALLGHGTHVVTANDYLAKRDAAEMGPAYQALGLSVGVIYPQQAKAEKKAAYAADITYGTHSEFGFDYLRDHIGVFQADQRVQRKFFYAIIDEADSILIDEARTPLIISRSAEGSMESRSLYEKMAKVAQALQKDRDYTVDLKKQITELNEEGLWRVEQLLGHPVTEEGPGGLFALNQSLKAKELFHEGDEYVINHGKVEIVDPFTGRVNAGRRWSEGLHLAIECKEVLAGKDVTIQGETETDASVTYQNLFRLYPKLAGMTGTAATEANEFIEVYGLPTVAVPTNRPFIQKQEPDVFAPSLEEKFLLVRDEIARVHASGRPILVGTASIEASELLSMLLKQQNIPHQVLNAKNHAKEAEIIADAGRPGAVTIATNMAGRGTDIKLGGSSGVLKQAIAARKETLAGLAKQIEVVSQWQTRLSEPAEVEALIQGRLKQIEELLQGQSPEEPITEEMRGTWRLIAQQELKREQEGNQRQLADLHRQQSEQQAQLAQDEARLARDEQTRPAQQEQLKALGGLYVIGTERFESRRIDNQLAGRCARQGDPGTVRFFLSTRDELFKVNGQQLKYWNWVEKLLGGGQPDLSNPRGTESASLGRTVTRFQKSTEERNFESRKHLLKYDTILDHYRRTTYGQRDHLLEITDPSGFKAYLSDLIQPLVSQVLTDTAPLLAQFSRMTADQVETLAKTLHTGEPVPEAQLPQLQALEAVYLLHRTTGIPIETFQSLALQTPQEAAQSLSQKLVNDIVSLSDTLPPALATELLRAVLLKNKDHFWKTFLNDVESLKSTIQFEAWSGTDPLLAYQNEVPKLQQQMRHQEVWANLAQLLPLARQLKAQPEVLPLVQRWFQDPALARMVPAETLQQHLTQLQGLADRLKTEPQIRPLVDLFVSLPQLGLAHPNWQPVIASLLTAPIPRLDGDANSYQGLIRLMYLQTARQLSEDPTVSQALGPTLNAVIATLAPLCPDEEALPSQWLLTPPSADPELPPLPPLAPPEDPQE